MSVRVYKLALPDTYDEIHFRVYQELENGSATAQIAFVQATRVIQTNTESIPAETIERWRSTWDPSVRVLEEHFLVYWAQEHGVQGSLAAANKGG